MPLRVRDNSVQNYDSAAFFETLVSLYRKTKKNSSITQFLNANFMRFRIKINFKNAFESNQFGFENSLKKLQKKSVCLFCEEKFEKLECIPLPILEILF